MDKLLGLSVEPRDLTYLQITARAIIVFIAALIMVRMAAKRFLGRKTAFDFILAIMLGSVLSRAINGSGPFFQTLVVGFVLVLIHRGMAALAFHHHWFGDLVKGHEDTIIENGKINEKALHQHYLSERDLMEDLRLKSCESPEQVKVARVERSGDVSVIRFDGKPAESKSRSQEAM